MPNRVDWNPHHSVGDATLDAQHQELLARCTALGDYLAPPDTDPAADRRFDQAFAELMALARAHFAAEESLLAARGYAGVGLLKLDDCRHSAHKDQTLATIEAINRFVEALDSDGLRRKSSQNPAHWRGRQRKGADYSARMPSWIGNPGSLDHSFQDP